MEPRREAFDGLAVDFAEPEHQPAFEEPASLPFELTTDDGGLLIHRTKWDDAETYPKLRKAIAKPGKVDLGQPRLAEVEVGGEKFLGAFVQTDEAAQWLVGKAMKLRPYKFPEVVCGDANVLDSAGVVVHREIALDPAAG